MGREGRVVGVDMTREMVEKALKNARRYGYCNVEFILGDIEALPVEDNSVDYVISNCVINLAKDKSAVFKEAYRVLRKGGKLLVSDIVLLKELTASQRNDRELLVGCVGNAVLRDDYLRMMSDAGFNVAVKSEDRGIGGRQ